VDTILVVCGAGASSTFLASRMRTIATQRGFASLTARAASTHDVASRLSDAVVLLVGPHLAEDFDTLAATASEHGVPAALLPSSAFGAAGATDALDLALSLLPAAPHREGSTHG
jgi:cellobiose PTS system EIIB component